MSAFKNTIFAYLIALSHFTLNNIPVILYHYINIIKIKSGITCSVILFDNYQQA